MQLSRLKKLCVSILSPVIILATGCVNVGTLPGYARSGDLVSVGLAGIKFNTDGVYTLRPADLTATITDADSVVHEVKVVDLFRAYPDHTSLYSMKSQDRVGSGYFADVQPYDGQWWITVQLVDPVTDTPLSLVAGEATLSVYSTEITDDYTSDGDMTDLPIEIIAGTAAPKAIDFYQYSAYRAQKTLLVRPSSLAGVDEVGGVQIKLDYDPAALSSGTPLIPRLVPISHDPNLSILQNTIDNGDGTHALIAMVANPNGFIDFSTGNWEIGQSTYKDLNFAVIVDDDNELSNWSSNYSLDAAESFYIDTSGNSLPGVNPVLSISN